MNGGDPDGPELDAHAFAHLAEEMFAAGGSAETASQVIEIACHELDMDDAGVVMVRRGGHLETIAETSELFGQLIGTDRVRDDIPFFDQSWSAESLAIGDLTAEHRWPDWVARVVALDSRSLLTVELTSSANQRRPGFLALFGAQCRTFDQDDLAFAQILARHAALAISSAEHNDHLTTALDSRKLIGQAQGILMERYRIDDATAFAVLKRYSQDRNVKLRLIARQLVDELPQEPHPRH